MKSLFESSVDLLRFFESWNNRPNVLGRIHKDLILGKIKIKKRKVGLIENSYYFWIIFKSTRCFIHEIGQGYFRIRRSLDISILLYIRMKKLLPSFHKIIIVRPNLCYINNNTSVHLKSLTLNIYIWKHGVYEQNIMSTIWMANFASNHQKRIQMLSGKYIFAQLIEFLPQNYFQILVMEYKRTSIQITIREVSFVTNW